MIISVNRVKAVMAAAKEAAKAKDGLFYLTERGIIWGTRKGFGHFPLGMIGEPSPFPMPAVSLKPSSVVHALDYANRYYPLYDLSFVYSAMGDSDEMKMHLHVGTDPDKCVLVTCQAGGFGSRIPSGDQINLLLAEFYNPTDKFVGTDVLMPILRPLSVLHDLIMGPKSKKTMPWSSDFGIRLGAAAHKNIAIWAAIGGGATIKQVGVVAPVHVDMEGFVWQEESRWA